MWARGFIRRKSLPKRCRRVDEAFYGFIKRAFAVRCPMIDFPVWLAYNGISQKDRMCIHARIPPDWYSGGISLG